jgi:hypothetical protein
MVSSWPPTVGFNVKNSSDNYADTAGSQVVTQWTTAGQLGANTRWVMTGGNSYRNYVMAGGPQLQASYSQSVTATVSGSSLRWPSGGEWFKGFLGQRILK